MRSDCRAVLAAIWACCAASCLATGDGTMLLDDATSRTRVVTNAFFNASNAVHDLIQNVSPRADFSPSNLELVDTISGVADYQIAVATNAIMGDVLGAGFSRLTTNDVENIVTNTEPVYSLWNSYDMPVLYRPDFDPTYQGYVITGIGYSQGVWYVGYQDTSGQDPNTYESSIVGSEDSLLLTLTNAPAVGTFSVFRTIDGMRNALGLARLSDLNTSINSNEVIGIASNLTTALENRIENGDVRAYYANIANEATTSMKTFALDGVDVTISAEEVIAQLATASHLTTNDVCNIVTNAEDNSVWHFSGVGQTISISNLRWTGLTPSDMTAGRVSFDLSGSLGSHALSWNFDGIHAVDIGGNTVIFDLGGTAGSKPNRWNIDIGADRLTYDGVNPVSFVNALGLARLIDLPPLTNGLATASITNGFITDAYISTNNAAFVNAVTNCPVAIAAGDAEALAEWGIYGSGGTIGALLAALAAAVAALKKKKMPLYPVGGTGNPVNATYESGVLTVSPFSMAAYAPSASAAFSVAMGALPNDLESGKARDAVLVIDCSLLSDGDEPTVTWDTHYHPRTDAGTDFACVAGAKNVYYISEYASGEFAVGGWTETEGGNT